MSQDFDRSGPGATTSAYGDALLSPSRADTQAGGLRGDALDATFDKLELEARLFPPQAGEPAPCIEVGEFRLVSRLGIGGMGSVYRAWSSTLERDAALKKLNDAEDDPERLPRLLHEARCLARVRHPNVVHIDECEPAAPWRVVDGEATTAGTTAVIVMEYLEGDSLRAWLRRAPRRWREILDVCLQAARGLAAAHRAGLLHGDLTLNNIVVTRDGAAKLVDFGLAKPQLAPAPDAPPWAPEIRLHELCGTPGYVAPEQLLVGGLVDARTDLFSLCVVVWEALCRSLPYPAAVLTPRTLRDDAPLPRPDLRAWPGDAPQWLRGLLLRGLALAPRDRPPSVHAWIAEVERHLRPRRPALAWLAGGLTGAAAAFALLRPAAPPAPLGADDPGLAAVVTADRRAAAERLAPGLGDRLGQFARAWEDDRAAARGLDRALQADAARCLVAARELAGEISAAVAARDALAPPELAERWAAELAPPRCADPAALARPGLAARLFAAEPGTPAHDLARGLALLRVDELDRAAHHLRRALASDDPQLRGRAHHRLGAIALQRRALAPAAEHLHAALRELEAGDDRLAVVAVLVQLTHLAELRGDDPQLALAHVARARDLLRWLRDDAGASEFAADLDLQAAWSLLELHARGRAAACPLPGPDDPHACAARLIDRAAAHTSALAGPQSRLLYHRAQLLRDADDPRALDLATRAVALDGAAGRPTARTPAMLTLLADLEQPRDPAAAERLLRRALAASDERGLGGTLADCQILGRLAILADARGDRPAALAAAGRAAQILDAHPPTDIATALDILDSLAALWLSSPDGRGRGLAVVRRGLDLAAAHRAALRPRGRALAASLHGHAAAALTGPAALAEARAGLEWLPADADFIVDAEYRRFAADLRLELAALAAGEKI
jgi:hypothetical protein